MASRDDPFANAIWTALHSTHHHLALTHDPATRPCAASPAQ
jgi:hypothetical protein